MKLIETLVRGKTVRMLYGNGPTKDDSSEWLEMQIETAGDDNRRLGVIHQAALQRLRDLLAAENRRFQSLSDQLP